MCIVLSKDKLDYHNQKWGFLGTVFNIAICFSSTINEISFRLKCLLISKMFIYCFQLSVSDTGHKPLILFISIKHLKMVFAESKHFNRHVLFQIQVTVIIY